MLQLCHNKAEVIIDDVEIVENGVEVSGEILVKILYITSEDKAPFASLVGSIPFTYQLDAPNICEECQVRVRGHVEQINVTMIDSEEFDVKVVVCFNVIAFCNTDEKVVAGVEEKDFDTAKMSERPSMVAYIVKKGDTLWDIGKKYDTPIAALKETNNITGEVKAGDKLLVVKTINQP